MTNYFPQNFVTQSYSDWINQAERIYSNTPTKTKTIILPPKVNLCDSRLKNGVVVAERKYKLESGKLPSWPENQMFECDVDKALLNTPFESNSLHTHFSVYPNSCFGELACKFCEPHKS